ncbi:MAG: DUF2029 domain-containing protein [Methylotenera sp.]|nr:DUF2029 domain-containing protein [Oligoflexia bacterium]
MSLKFLKRFGTQLTLGFFVLLSLLLRISLFSHESEDYQYYLQHWMQFIRSRSWIADIRGDYTNYTPAYSYLLTFMNGLLPNASSLSTIKILSISFDYVGAFLVHEMVRLKHLQGPLPAIAAIVFLFAPTLVLNSAYWGQCDGIYTALLLAAVYWAMRGRHAGAAAFLGLAIAFKLQGVFLLPLFAVLLVRGAMRWQTSFIVPGAFILLSLPAILAGRPAWDTFAVYLAQSKTYEAINMNAPNLSRWFPNTAGALWAQGAILLAVILTGALVLGLGRRPLSLHVGNILALGLLSVILVPFLLPKMHERYFYPADALSIAYAFHFPKRFWVAVVVTLASLFSYFPYLFHSEPVSLKWLAISLGAVILTLLQQLKAASQPSPDSPGHFQLP